RVASVWFDLFSNLCLPVAPGVWTFCKGHCLEPSPDLEEDAYVSKKFLR
ncbi:hypothetical protein A2U01_0096731, partial [Trifolium medium]|nr:hypothetical protein [Trifolium medium]